MKNIQKSNSEENTSQKYHHNFISYPLTSNSDFSLHSKPTISTSKRMHIPSSSGNYYEDSPFRIKLGSQRREDQSKSIILHEHSQITSFSNNLSSKSIETLDKKNDDKVLPKYRGGWQLQTIPEAGTPVPKRRNSKPKSSTVVPSLKGTTIYSSSLTYKPKPGSQPQTSKSKEYDLDDPRLELKLMNENLKFDPHPPCRTRKEGGKNKTNKTTCPQIIDLEKGYK